ncbi:tensin-2-like, partial [Oxyura jamaicensis]|uniref:tensin-2-like n=1 Tax=Oxyura jamaicensis TaxID=8884 RepID=UPI0015A4FE37
GSTKSLSSTRQHSTLPRSLSVAAVLERAAELDLSYVTERVLALSFPPALDERRLRGHLRDVAQMLRSRHRERYAVRRGHRVGGPGCSGCSG